MIEIALVLVMSPFARKQFISPSSSIVHFVYTGTWQRDIDAWVGDCHTQMFSDCSACVCSAKHVVSSMKGRLNGFKFFNKNYTFLYLSEYYNHVLNQVTKK